MTIWAGRAAEASAALVGVYWNGRRDLFGVASARRRLRPPRHWHYWWQAHALEALVLAGDGDRAARLVRGVLRRNGGHITNEYYDDMAWMGLALHAWGGLAGPAGARAAQRLVAELMAALRRGVDPRHGAVVWRRGDTYLNVAANAPTAILAARTGDETFARRLAAWLHDTLVTADGTVLDGLHPGAGLTRTGWTYNYGTVIGADLAVGEVDRARRVATAALRLVRDDGVLPDEGGGDGALFKGILARHLGALVAATGDTAARDLLIHNAEAAWSSRSPRGLVGPDWARRPRRPFDLSAHLSGVLLLHTAAALTA
jgi:predicted alpha-1,6-mannanase (GH76 family)